MATGVTFLRGCQQCSLRITREKILRSSHSSMLAVVTTGCVSQRNLSLSTRLFITPKRNTLPPPPLLQPELLPERQADTIVVERLWKLPPGEDGGRPPRSQMNELYKLLKMVDGITYPKDMPCILTEFVDGIGIRGDVVTVKRDLFHSELFPSGLAVYASPENIEEFEEERKAAGIEKVESRLGVLARMTMKELNQLTLEIPLRDDIEWTLNKTHVQVAFRLQGINLDEDCIEIATEAVTEFGKVALSISINGLESVDMQAVIVPVLEKFPPSKKLY